MLSLTLVKLAVHALLHLWLNSKYILFDRMYIRDISQTKLLLLYLLFLDQYPWVLFLLSHSFTDNTFSDAMTFFLSFWVTSTQFIFFSPFKKDYMQNFVWKDNNHNFKFCSISPLGRNRIKHLSSTSKLHHHWAETELMYWKHNYI